MDKRRYRESEGILSAFMATLRSLAMNALRMDALAHGIRELLELVGRRQATQPQDSA